MEPVFWATTSSGARDGAVEFKSVEYYCRGRRVRWAYYADLLKQSYLYMVETDTSAL